MKVRSRQRRWRSYGGAERTDPVFRPSTSFDASPDLSRLQLSSGAPPASSPTRAVMMDVFLDIQLMAKGDYFLHGASSVAEAVIYTNIGLHERSVHLEYRHNHSRDAPWLESAGVRRAEDRRRQF